MKNLTLLKLAAAIATVTSLGLSSGCTESATTEAERPALTTFGSDTYTPDSTDNTDYTDNTAQGTATGTSTSGMYSPMGTERETELHITRMPSDGFKTDDLIGQNVLNRGTKQNVGEVTDIVIDRDGKVVAVIVGIAGELGSERSVAIGWDQLERSIDGEVMTLFVGLDESELDSAPEYASN